MNINSKIKLFKILYGTLLYDKRMNINNTQSYDRCALLSDDIYVQLEPRLYNRKNDLLQKYNNIYWYFLYIIFWGIIFLPNYYDNIKEEILFIDNINNYYKIESKKEKIKCINRLVKRYYN